MTGGEPLRGRVVTVSDRCSRGEADDLSGPLAARLLAEHGIIADHVELVPDGVEPLQAAIRAAVADGVQVLVTTGGTGISPRDLTPEATGPLLEVRLDGVADAIRSAGLAQTPFAVLSRGLAGITRRGPHAMLIVNAPGSPGGVQDAVSVLGPLARHVVDQAAGGDHRR